MQERLKKALKDACEQLFGLEAEIELDRPEEKFGDYATNVALQLAADFGNSPREIAQQIAGALKSEDIAKMDVAGPGFINITLSDAALAETAEDLEPAKSRAGQEILVEFGDPNPFKEMHIGHAYSYIAGDAIAGLLAAAGAKVHRLSYHGDVGRQVAQAIWGMRQFEVNNDADLGKAYAKGAQAYADDPKAKTEIDAINQHIYMQDDQQVNQLHRRGTEISFRHFDKILDLLSISIDKRYLESQTTPLGMELVKNNIGKVFTQSDGAVVYQGEKAGLHTRVFITSQGLPTYETKDLGLIQLKDQDYPAANQSIVITANEQAEYFKVMLAALAEIKPELARKTEHLSHGFLSLTTGKMSSRTGEIIGAAGLIQDVDKAIVKTFHKESASTRNAAIKYGLLKHRLGSDITYDVDESINLEGNSGPYLQYAHARAKSVLRKASQKPAAAIKDLQSGERSLLRKISQYPEVVAKAVDELAPSYVCTYLYELAQGFNRFYENNRVVGDERESIRLVLVKKYADVLKHGLELLNIEAPEKI